MDLNFRRAKREKVIALEVARELLSEIKPIDNVPPPLELIAHHYVLVCNRLDVATAEATEAAGRVLKYALDIIQRKRRQLDRMTDEVDRITERVITSTQQGVDTIQ